MTTNTFTHHNLPFLRLVQTHEPHAQNSNYYFSKPVRDDMLEECLTGSKFRKFQFSATPLSSKKSDFENRRKQKSVKQINLRNT